MLVVLTSHSSAQADPDPEPDRKRFAQGVIAAQRGVWREALAAFEAIYRNHPTPAVLLNLAGAQLRTGKLLASNNNYRRLLSSAGLAPAERQVVERQLQLLASRIPRLRIHLQGLRVGDTMFLDGVRIYAHELDRDMWLDPGAHELRVVHAQGAPESRTVVLSEGELRVLALGLR